MQMLVLIIRPHMLLITMAELMKFQQGMQVLMLMIRPHMLPIIMAEFMKIQQGIYVLILIILLHVLLHSRINENSRPCIGVNTHISTPTVFPKPGSIKWQFYFSGTYDAFLALQKKFEKYYLK